MRDDVLTFDISAVIFENVVLVHVFVCRFRIIVLVNSRYIYKLLLFSDLL